MSDQFQETAEIDHKEQDSKKVIVIVVISILLAVNGLLLWQFFDKKTHLEEVNKTLDSTIAERDAISAELQRVKNEYDKINQENAGLQSQLSAKDEEIKNKIAEIQRLINSGDAVQLQKAREELSILKALNQRYITQIDSLRIENEQLVAQTELLNEDLSTERGKVQSLTQENTLLANKVAIGSILRTVNVSSVAVRYKSNGREAETKRASRASKIKTCFTILENNVVNKGTKDAYIRVLGPDGSVITTSTESFMYNGQATLYTTRDSFDFDNQRTSVCIYSDKGSQLSGGDYTVEIYSGGSIIGSTKMKLK